MPRSHCAVTDTPTRVLDPLTLNFQEHQRRTVRRPCTLRTTACAVQLPGHRQSSPKGAGARLKPRDRKGDELRVGRDSGSPRTSLVSIRAMPGRGSGSSPVTASVLPLWLRQAGPRGQGLSPVLIFNSAWFMTPGLKENPRGRDRGQEGLEVSLGGLTSEGQVNSIALTSRVSCLRHPLLLSLRVGR